MTTTNQAFIKVYRHDAAQTGPSQAIAAEDRLSAAVLCASVEIVAAAGSYAARSPAALEGTVPWPRRSTNFLRDATVCWRRRLLKAGWGRVAAKPRPQSTGEPTRGRNQKSPGRHSCRGSSRHSPSSHKRKPFLSVPAHGCIISLAGRLPCFSQESAAELNGVANQLLDEVGWALRVWSDESVSARRASRHPHSASRKIGRPRPMRGVSRGSFYMPRLAKWLDVVPTAGWQEVLDNTRPSRRLGPFRRQAPRRVAAQRHAAD